MSPGSGRPRRALVALLALAGLVSACSSPGGGDDATATTSSIDADGGPSTLAASSPWVVSVADDVVVIEADEYDLHADLVDGLALTLRRVGDRPVESRVPGPVLEGGEGVHPVVDVVDTKPGLDHVTFFVRFADGSTGRVELGAETDRTILVGVESDAPGVDRSEHRLVVDRDGVLRADP